MKRFGRAVKENLVKKNVIASAGKGVQRMITGGRHRRGGSTAHTLQSSASLPTSHPGSDYYRYKHMTEKDVPNCASIPVASAKEIAKSQ